MSYSNLQRGKKINAKIDSFQATVLGMKVNLVTKSEAVDAITAFINNGQSSVKQVVTAYSEFFVAGTKDKEFQEVVNSSDLVVPDGVGVLAAVNFLRSIKLSDGPVVKFIRGLVTGKRILFGQVGQPVSGVWLFSKLMTMAAEKRWKVFLLGGFGGAAAKLASNFKECYPGIDIAFDGGRVAKNLQGLDDAQVLKRINDFKPDILFVAYGPIKQEKWIAKNKPFLKAKVAVGVGGTFDEILGLVKPAPGFMEKVGLKWLWRFIQEPKRARRIFNAYPVFPLMVFGESLSLPKRL